MIVVHHLNNSRSQRVLWLLEELGLDYEVRRYERNPKTMLAPPELRQVHPLGKSPDITDGPLTLAESGAIIEYLVQRYGAGRFAPPVGTLEHVRYIYWLHYAEGSAMPPLLMRLIFGRMAAGPVPFLLKGLTRKIAETADRIIVAPQLKLHLDYLEGELRNSEWFAGQEFSAADIQMSFPLEAARMRAGLDESRPRLMNFLSRIHARPAYLKALERGGKYDFAK